MNFKENESANKLRGGYYTEPDIANFLLRWVLSSRPESLLEPSCGDGVFFRSLKEFGNITLHSISGFEIEPSEVKKSRLSIESLQVNNAKIYQQDFIEWFLSLPMAQPVFDCVVGNPPFVRYQYLNEKQQENAEEVYDQFNLKFTRHTNAWVPFVIASLALLKPKGRFAMVLPAEILHILHAESLRSFMTKQCSHILVFDPQEIWFENTLQGAILVLAEKKENIEEPCKGIGIIPTKTRAFLSDDPEKYYLHADYANGSIKSGKWMPALLDNAERALLNDVKTRHSVYKFDDIAEVAVGIVTGANNFFLVPNDIVEKYSLQKWSFPMFGRSEHVPGVVFDNHVYEENQRKGLPTNFIWFQDEELDELPPDVQEYLKLGVKLGLPKRYKCRVREPWYSVPSVYFTSVGMLKRSHDYPRLIMNKSNAYTTDTAYRIKTKQINSNDLVFSFINSLTILTAELEGRHYGGGVLELVPSEIRKLAIPLVSANEDQVYGLDRRIKEIKNPELILDFQDEHVLKRIGFSKQECEILRNAWLRLRARRQRTN